MLEEIIKNKCKTFLKYEQICLTEIEHCGHT